jgi:hypothetical protein
MSIKDRYEWLGQVNSEELIVGHKYSSRSQDFSDGELNVFEYTGMIGILYSCKIIETETSFWRIGEVARLEKGTGLYALKEKNHDSRR